MTTYRTRAVFLAILMLVSPIAGVAGSATAATTAGPDAAETQQSVETAQSELPGNFINLTDDVSLWDRAVLPLRLDRTDADGVSTSVDNLNVRLEQPGVATRDLNVPHLVTYENDTTLDLSFDDSRPVADGETNGYEVELIAIKAESTDAPDAPASLDIQGLREFAQNQSNSEELFIESVSTQTIENGEADFEFDLSEDDRGAGSYTFMLAHTTEGSGFTVEDGNLSVDGQVEILGADAAVVEQTSSDVRPDRDSYEPGETIEFDVDSNLDTDADRVEHAVALWNESAVSNEDLKIIAPDELDSDTTLDEFTIEHSIAEVAGEANMEDDVTAFGQTISANDGSGVVALGDVISFLANEGNFTGPNTTRTGDTVINASITSVNSTSNTETIEVGTLDSFETGEYVAVHVAMADRDLTQTSSNRTTVTLVDERANFQIEDTDTNSPVVEGETLEVDATINNTGNVNGTQTVTLENESGATVAEETLALEAGETADVTLAQQTAVGDATDETYTVQTADDSATVPVTILEQANFDVTLNLDPPNDGDEYATDEHLTGNVTIENTGEAIDEQNVSVSLDDDGLNETTVELAGDEEATLLFNRSLTADDAGDRTVIARSDDDVDAQAITIAQPPTFAVDILEDESDLTVVAGQNVSVVAEIINLGDEEGTQDVTLTNVTAGVGDELATEEITLEPGADYDFEAEFETTTANAGTTIDLEVASDDESDTTTAEVEDRDAYLDVTIDDLNRTEVNEPADVTVPVQVNVTVENLGTNETTQDITFTKNGDQFALESDFTVDGDSTDTLNETVDVETGDAPALAIGVASEDDSDDETLDVTPLAEFDVTIVEASNVSQPVPNDSGFAPTINVTNVGGQPGDAELTVEFNGTTERTFDPGTLGPDEEVTVVQPNDGFEINVSDVPTGPRLLEAIVTNDETDATDDSSTRRVTVGEAANFEVENLDITSSTPVDQGDNIEVSVTVNNTGDVEGSGPVVVDLGDREITVRDIEDLQSDESETIDVSFRARSGDVGADRELSASTPDDEQTDEITILGDAEFLIGDFSVDDDAIAGESAAATVDIRNVGGLAGNQTDLRLLVDGNEVDRIEDIELGANERTVESFSFVPDEAGDVEVLAVTDDDLDRETVAVGTPGELELEIRSVTDPVTTGETVEIDVRAENVGDGDIEEDVSLTFDGEASGSETVSLAGGERERITLTHDVTRSVTDEETVDFTVSGPETLTGTVTIQPQPDDPFFRVSSLEISDDEVLNESRTVTVTANVTNIGDQTDTQDVTFTAGAVSETNESIQLGDNESVTVDFDFDPVDVGETGEVTYEVASENQTASDTLTITEPADATPEIVEVDFDDTATQNEPFEATVTVENVGDLPLDGDETLTLDAADETELVDGATTEPINASEEIAPGDTETVTLSVTPAAEPRAGAVDRQFTVSATNFDDVDAVTETVALDFQSIRSGVAEADEGDTVVVEPGTYAERRTITVDTAGVSIEPADGSVEIRQPRRGDPVAVSITADDVSLTDLTLTGDGSGTGVKVAGSADDVTLTDLRIQNWGTGVDETAGENSYVGLTVVDSEVGIAAAGSGDSTIEFTRVARSGDTGVLVESDGVEVLASQINRAPVGIDAFAKTVVEETTVRNAEDYGVRVTDVPGDLNNDPSANITRSSLESNQLSLLADGSEVDADQNWWGEALDTRARQNVDWVARSDVSATDPLDSRSESNFNVSEAEIDSNPVVIDEQFEVTATVENDGSATDRQRIELVDGGDTIDSTSRNLSAGESTEVTLTYTPDATDDGSLNLSVESLDDTDEIGEIDVVDPAEFGVTIDNADTDVPLGTDLDVDVTVENIGGVAGDATIELSDFDGTVVDSADQTVAGAASEARTLTWTTDQTGTDEITVEVFDEDGVLEATATETVTVADAALDDVTLALGDTPLTVGDTTDATVTAAFTDASTSDVTGQAAITSNDASVATVDGTEVTAEGSGTTTIEATYTENGETETDTVDLTVNEDTRSPSGGGARTPPDPDEPIDVEPEDPPGDVTVELDETVDFVFDGETGQTTATFSEQSAVDSVTFDFEIAGSVNARTLDRESDETGPAPGASAAVSQISVGDELRDQPATIGMRVSQERLAEIDADAEDLRINRFADGEWQGLDTEIIDETDTQIRVQAETPGFSYFSVSAVSEPEAAASVSPETVTTDETVELSGSESTDRYGEIVAYDWEIDGETFSGETTTLTVDEPGEYTAELTVTNDAGETDTTTVDFTVTAVDDDDVPDDTDEEAFGTGAIAVIVLVIIAILAAAGVAVMRRKE